jgi:hypothetical protein
VKLLYLVLVFAGCGGGADVDRAIGARCDVTSECDERCVAPGADAPGGFCTIDCGSSDDCTGDTECVEREGGICLFACDGNDDCAFLGEGWTCQEDSLRVDPALKTSVCRG